MKTPPSRPTLPPTPSGLQGRPPEPPMHPSSHRIPQAPLLILQALALSIAATGCFNPLVTLETDEADSDGAATDAATDGSTTDEMTTAEPDSGSGDGPAPVCGNGVVEDDELCDDGVNDGSYGGCNADCTAPGPFCGDGVVNGEEPCDDGDDVDGNGCNVDCVVSGSVLWTVTVDGPDHAADIASSVAIDSADNIVVAGMLTTNGVNSVWVAKYAPDGQEAWSTTYCPDGGDCFAHDVAVTPDGGIVVVGSVSAGDSPEDAWIRRYTAEGDVAWTHTHDGPAGGADSARTAIADEDGYTYVVIRQNFPSTVDIVRKYDSDGGELWSTYQPGANRIDDFALLPSGNLMLASREGTNQSWTPLLQEMNRDGGIVWQMTNAEHGEGWYSSIDASSSGEMVVTIRLQGMNDTRIARLAPDGQEEWLEMPWAFNSSTQSAIIDDFGWIACTGSAGQDATLWTRKYEPQGSESWTDTYNGAEALLAFDQGEEIARDSQGNLIVVGSVQDTEETGVDAWIRKYSP